MRRDEFDHVLGAAAELSGHDEFVVIGSQAVLGVHPAPPEPLLQSIEADVYPRHAPNDADRIDGAIGDGSQFHLTHGYYAHGVGPETAKAPRGWEDRLVRVEIPPRPRSTRAPVAWCLEMHDLVLSKCVAGRQRDWDYAREALTADLVQSDTLLARIPDLPVSREHQSHIEKTVRGIIRSL